MKVTLVQYNAEVVPEAITVKRILIEQGDLEIEISQTLGEGLVIRGIMGLGAGIVVIPKASNAIKIMPATSLKS